VGQYVVHRELQEPTPAADVKVQRDAWRRLFDLTWAAGACRLAKNLDMLAQCVTLGHTAALHASHRQLHIADSACKKVSEHAGNTLRRV
jgi:hypothetical protein